MPTGIYKHPIQCGFQKGHGYLGGGPKKGHIPWNKGKKETRLYVLKKISISHLGKESYTKGKHHTKETKRKIGLANKDKIRSLEAIENMKKSAHRGENNYRWIKDRSLLKKKNERNDMAYQWWVKQCKIRDHYKCKINNDDCSGYCIVHHILSWINFPELRYEVNNGITLCQFHHPRKKMEEQKLIPFFQNLVEVK